jgi:ankyrin repeat protein
MDTFFQAIREGDELEVTRLLDADPGLLEKELHKGNTPLAVAAAWGHLELVTLLFQRGASANATGLTGKTALHWAAYRGQEGVVTFLLRQGARANSRDDVGKTPLMLACRRGYVAVVRILLQHMGTHDLLGAEAMQETDDKGCTALYWAAYRGHEAVVSLLLEQGAHADSRSTAGHTPLLVASEQGHRGVVRMLLQHMGAEGLQEKDANGKTVLHWAVEKGYHKAVKLLLLAGADPTITDNEGRTPLALAERRERAGCVAAFEVCKSRVLYPHSD